MSHPTLTQTASPMVGATTRDKAKSLCWENVCMGLYTCGVQRRFRCPCPTDPIAAGSPPSQPNFPAVDSNLHLCPLSGPRFAPCSLMIMSDGRRRDWLAPGRHPCKRCPQFQVPAVGPRARLPSRASLGRPNDLN